MQAKDIMTPDVVTVSPETAVAEIAATLLERRISAVPVVDANKKIVGIVSEGDLMRRPENETQPHHSWWLGLARSPGEDAAEFLKTHGTKAADVMTRKVVSVGEDAPVGDIAQILEEHRIKRVPVVRDGKLVGIVSRANLIRAIATHRDTMAAVPSGDDDSLRQAVLKKLKNEGFDDFTRINPLVADGVVYLWGLADSETEKRAMGVAVESVPGVASVENHLTILSGLASGMTWGEF